MAKVDINGKTYDTKFDLVCSIAVQSRGGTHYIAHDITDGREIDDDYSIDHLKQRLVSNGWAIMNIEHPYQTVPVGGT